MIIINQDGTAAAKFNSVCIKAESEIKKTSDDSTNRKNESENAFYVVVNGEKYGKYSTRAIAEAETDIIIGELTKYRPMKWYKLSAETLYKMNPWYIGRAERMESNYHWRHAGSDETESGTTAADQGRERLNKPDD